MSYSKTARKCIVLFLVNKILKGTKQKHFEIKRRLLNSIGYQIGENTKVVGPIHCVHPITIGKNCWIGENFTVHGDGKVLIGDNCDLAPDVVFLTGGHEIGDRHRRAGKGQIYSIFIGSGVWIGARSTIGRNVTIADGCVVAACACVMNSVEADTLVGGVPAKVIRRLESETNN